MGFMECVGGVWIIDLEKAIKGRFYGCGVDKSFWCFLLFNSLKNSMQKFRNHPYTGCCRNSATTDSLGVAEILQALIHRVSQKFCEHSYIKRHRNNVANLYSWMKQKFCILSFTRCCRNSLMYTGI